jgi:hypothetical protein
MPRVEQFPYEISKAEETRLANTPKQVGMDGEPLHSIMFEQVEVTIEAIPWKAGFVFKEDPYVMDNGYKIAWVMKTKWDEGAGKSKPYEAEEKQKGTPSDALTWGVGDTVRVALSRRDYWDKNKQQTTPKGVIAWGVKVGSSADSSDAPTNRTYSMTGSQNRPAALGMTANMLHSAKLAGMTEEIYGVTPEAAIAILRDVAIANLEGHPLDKALEPFHALLTAGIEEPGEVEESTAVEESPMVQAALDAGATIVEKSEKVEKLEW